MSNVITCILSMDLFFILKNMIKVERVVILEFVSRDQLLMSLKGS